MTSVNHRITAEELLAMPREGPCELIAGEIVKMTPTFSGHGSIAGTIAVLVGGHAKQAGLGRIISGEGGFLIATDPDTVRVPDVAFVRREREAQISQERYFPGPPDLAVEVVSLSDRVKDVNEKAKAWIDAGTPLVWIVWPETRSVTVYRPGRPPLVLREQDTITGEDIVPGFQCGVAEFFS